MKRILLILMVVSVAVIGCDKRPFSPFHPFDPFERPDDGNPGGGDDSGNNPSGTGKDEDVNTDGTGENELDDSEFTETIDLEWNGSEVKVTNGTSLSVVCDNGHVVVGNATSEGRKVRINLSGKSSDGSLKIYNGVKSNDTNRKMLLSLNGVDLTSSKGPAINIQSGKTVYVLLSEGKTNSLRDASTYTGVPDGEDAKGTFFSEKQLVFCGGGSLKVSSQAKHAIAVDDYMVIQSGSITVTGAASDGIHANRYVRIDGGTLDITSCGEGIQCEQADSGYFHMPGGKVKISTSGEKCGGIETALDIIIEGGELEIGVSGAASKCLKSDNNITISGGTLKLQTSGSGAYDSAEKDASAAACMKAENIITLKGGKISCKSTGAGGKGINCYKFICEDPMVLDVSISGTVYSSNNQKCRAKGIKATSAIVVNGRSINVLTSGTEAEGIESKGTIEVNGGAISVQAKDDGINAAATITFNGGYTYVYSTSNDGIDSNYNRSGAIVVNKGVVISHSASSPEEGLDADNNGNLSFNGGYVFCTGGQQGGGGGGMIGWGGPGGPGGPGGGGGGTSGSTPSCSQTTYLWNKTVSSGYFTVTDASGKVIMSCYVPRSLSQNYSFVSAPFTVGSSYKYGVATSAPTGATEVFGKYFYGDGTASVSTSFTAGSGYAGSL